MDRKAWIVVTLCLLLMGANFYYMQENQKLVEQQKAEEAKKNPPVEKVTTPDASAAKPEVAIKPATPEVPEQQHTLTTGSVSFELTSKGGGVARAVLAGTDHVTLNDHALEAVGALRREPAGLDAIAYAMSDATERSVTFTGTSTDGIQVKKVWSLTEGTESDEHLIDLTITLTNGGTAQHRSEEYYLYAGASTALNHADDRYQGFFWNDSGSAKYEFSSYFGSSTFSETKTEFRQSYNALRFTGVMSRFYSHILTRISDKDAPAKLWATRRQLAKPLDAIHEGNAEIKDYAAESAMSLPTVDLAPGASMTEKYQIYLGPKEYHRLDKIGKQRSFAMFYGYFSWVSIFLVSVMRWMHGIVGNWGVAVILLTIFVRLCIWPIHAKSTRTMKRMSLLGPLMKELQEKYKDNPQQQQMETMKLYRDYGVNPLGGCLPLLLQFPIFIGLYSMLEYAAELRGHGLWWVQDLSAADTVWSYHLPFSIPLIGANIDLNPLPIIMGLTMVAQMKLTPQPQSIDKMQQRIFMFMPLIFLFISYNFASALALYWSTQNLFSIFQTWVMKLYVADPVLEKVKREPKPAPQGSGSNPAGQQKDKKKINKPPRLGG